MDASDSKTMRRLKRRFVPAREAGTYAVQLQRLQARRALSAAQKQTRREQKRLKDEERVAPLVSYAYVPARTAPSFYSAPATAPARVTPAAAAAVVPPTLQPYALRPASNGDRLTRLLAELQHRDLTPEDYELLLVLDESLPKKYSAATKKNKKHFFSSFLLFFFLLTTTFSVPFHRTAPKDFLASLATRTVVAGSDHGPCMVCLEEYVDGDSVAVLPACKHEFHAACIQNWLSTSSACCPVDNLPVAP